MRELGCPKSFVCDGHMGECTVALYNQFSDYIVARRGLIRSTSGAERAKRKIMEAEPIATDEDA